jgi:ribosome-binding protein aMBF1 (putative translation factor)
MVEVVIPEPAEEELDTEMASASDSVPLTRDERTRLLARIKRLQAEVKGLRARLADREEDSPPELPPKDSDGTRPALETVRAILGQKVMAMRKSAGLTRAELARRARVKIDSLAQIERGEGSPNPTITKKIDRALKRAGMR